MVVADIEQKLAARHINPTAMRILVLDFLLKQQSANSLNDIEKGLQSADRITIYRTLKVFEGKGLIHAIENGTNPVKYALCLGSCDADKHHDLHVHFHCNTCKETFCLPNFIIPDVLLPEGFFMEAMNLIVKGSCKHCTD